MKTIASPLAACAVLGLASFGAVAQGQITRSGGGYLFRVKYTPGQTIRYAIDSDIRAPAPQGGQPGTFKMTIPMAMKVLDVKGKIATIQVQVGPMKTPGAASTAKPQTSIIKLNDRNMPVGGGSAGSAVGTALPEGPVKIGQTWTSSAPVPGMAPGAKATVRFKLLGIKSVNGKQAANLALTLDGAAKGTGTTLLSLADGQPLSMVMKLGVQMGAQNASMTMTMRRL